MYFRFTHSPTAAEEILTTVFKNAEKRLSNFLTDDPKTLDSASEKELLEALKKKQKEREAIETKEQQIKKSLQEIFGNNLEEIQFINEFWGNDKCDFNFKTKEGKTGKGYICLDTPFTLYKVI